MALVLVALVVLLFLCAHFFQRGYRGTPVYSIVGDQEIQGGDREEARRATSVHDEATMTPVSSIHPSIYPSPTPR